MPPPSRWTPSPISPSATRFDEVRVTHEQNLVLPHVALDDLPRGLRRRWQPIGLADGQRRPGHRHHRLPGPRLLRARQRPLDPDRAAHLRALRRPDAPARDRRAQDQDLRLHQRLRPPPRRPHRHPRRREEGRGALPDHARRLGRTRTRRSARSSAPASAPTASSTRSRRWSTPTSSCAPDRERALPRRLPPPRPRPVQGGALCRRLIPTPGCSSPPPGRRTASPQTRRHPRVASKTRLRHDGGDPCKPPQTLGPMTRPTPRRPPRTSCPRRVA